jgi:hypothetical protein
MEELQLHDIKGLVEIPDDSIYYFFGLIGLITVLLIIITVLWYRYLKRTKAVDLQKLYKEELLNSDLNQTKQTAYKLSHYGQLLDKNETQQAAFDLIALELKHFKYKKEVPAFDTELRSSISNFLDSLNAQ